MICLDTNAVIAVLNGKSISVRHRLREALDRGEQIAISLIVLSELFYGAAKSADRRTNEQRITDFLSGGIAILLFESDDAREAGEIRAHLEKLGRPIGPYDTLIAAQARLRRATLVTANTREFRRVPSLLLEDWSGS